jgi:hypothetical protein
MIPHDVRLLALAINDMGRRREKALGQLDPELYDAVINIISEIQIDKTKYDPQSLFPVVATNQFLESLLVPKRSCYLCHQKFTEGYDIHWKYCGKHGMCDDCIQNCDQHAGNPLLGLCDCVQD